MALTLKENNNVTIQAVVRDGSGQIQNITGWTFTFRVVDASNVLLFQKVSPAEIVIIDGPNGKVNILVVPADTNNKAGTYQFEFKGFDPVSNNFTLNGPAELIVSKTII